MAVTVRSYLDMLHSEVSRQPYVKSHFRKRFCRCSQVQGIRWSSEHSFRCDDVHECRGSETVQAEHISRYVHGGADRRRYEP